MSSFKFTRIVIGVMAVLFGVLAPADAVEFPYTAVVVEDQVPIRAGAGTTFYTVGHLAKGSIVNVDEVIFGWNKIVAPPRTYSYIAQSHVTPDADGKTGTVAVQRAPVKAASLRGPGDSYRRQLYVLEQQRVEIVGKEGGYYRILPPQGAYVFLRPGSVRQSDAGSSQSDDFISRPIAAQTTQTTLDESMESDQTDPSPTIATAETPTNLESQESKTAAESRPDPLKNPATIADANTALATNTPQPDDPIQPASTRVTGPAREDDRLDKPPVSTASPIPPRAEKKLVTSGPDTFKSGVSPLVLAAEQRIRGISTLPLEDQPIDELTRIYEELWNDSNLTKEDRRIVKARLAWLARNASLASALKNIADTKNQVDNAIPIPEPDHLDHESDTILLPLSTLPAVVTTPGRAYDVMGQLMASGVYNGVNLPQLFRVVDPGTGRTLAYVKPGAIYRPASTLGRYVGVMGTTRYDPALRLDVIDVEKLDLLEPSSN